MLSTSCPSRSSTQVLVSTSSSEPGEGEGLLAVRIDLLRLAVHLEEADAGAVVVGAHPHGLGQAVAARDGRAQGRDVVPSEELGILGAAERDPERGGAPGLCDVVEGGVDRLGAPAVEPAERHAVEQRLLHVELLAGQAACPLQHPAADERGCLDGGETALRAGQGVAAGGELGGGEVADGCREQLGAPLDVAQGGFMVGGSQVELRAARLVLQDQLRAEEGDGDHLPAPPSPMPGRSTPSSAASNSAASGAVNGSAAGVQPANSAAKPSAAIRILMAVTLLRTAGHASQRLDGGDPVAP